MKSKQQKDLKIFLVAGEASGDYLGARLIKALRQKYKNKGNLIIRGIGGEQMAKEGVYSDYSLAPIAVIGLTEVLSVIFRAILLMRKVANDIEQFQPDILVTIDSPGFCLKLASKVSHIRQKYGTKFIHYVSPTVWAYKKDRILQMEKIYDLVLAIFPFEPKHYKGSNLQCVYVGHPVLEQDWSKANKCRFRQKHNLSMDREILGVMVGSRVGEVKKFLPVFIAAINKAVVEHGINPLVVFPAVSEQVADLIASSRHKMKFEHKIIKPTSLKEKIEMLKAFDRAIVKSGTSTHELAAAHIPMITAYKVNPITYFIAKYVLKIPKRIKFISLVNLLLDEAVIPEYVQYECTADNLSDGLMKLYDPGFCTYQRRAYRTALRKLANPFNTHPSTRAAALILESVN